MPHISLFWRLACGSSPIRNFTSRVFSYLQPATTTKKRALNCSANYTASFVSQAKTGNQAFVRSRWHQKTPCFVCLKQSHLDASARPRAGLCCSSEQIGKQHKRSAREVPAGCHNMLVCRRTSVARSPCLIPLRLPLPFFSPPLSLSLSLLSPAHFTVYITCFLYTLPVPPVPDTQSLSGRRGLSVCVSFSSPAQACLPFSPTPPPPSLSLQNTC